MGTRACIVLKVCEADKGRSLSFNPSLLDAGMQLLDDNKFDKGPDGNYHHGPLTDNIFQTTERIHASYLAVYLQCDGYPTGLGAALLEHFATYDKAINLLAGGTLESLYNERMIYNGRRRDSLEENGYGNAHTPHQCAAPSPCESFQYLFYEARWYVRQYATCYYDLAHLLAARGDKADRKLPEMKEYRDILRYRDYPEAHDKAHDAFFAKWKTMLPVGRNLIHLRHNIS